MAIKDESRSIVRPEPKKKKRRAPVQGEQARGGSKVPRGNIPRGASVVEENRMPYRGSSNPAFARMGFSGDIFSLNRRAELANAAFSSQFGYEPSPGLLLDIIRAPIQNDEFEDMFKIPQSFQQARALAAENQAKLEGIEATAQQAETGEFASGVEQSQAHQQAALRAVEERPILNPQAMGFKDDIGLPGLALIQIGESLVYAPAGVYEMGKALGFDTRDATRGDFSAKRSRQMGKDIAKGVIESYENPRENPGYILMDAFGLASGIGGTASRLGRASRASGAGRAREFIRRSEPGRFELGGEQVLLTPNVTAQVVQRALLERRKKGRDRRHQSTERSFDPLTRRDRLVGQFSTESKIGREARARQRTEHTIALESKRELDAVRGRSITTAEVFRRWNRLEKIKGAALGARQKVRKGGLSRGEMKAIEVLATDEPGGWQAKLALHRSFHRKKLEEGYGDPDAHRRHLGDLDLAEKALLNPRERFNRAAELTRQVVAEQEFLKIERLGLDAEGAKSRVAAYAAVLRGEDVTPGLTKLDPESFYVPSVLHAKSRKPASERVPVPRPGPTGIPEPRNLPELTHQFTGDAIRWGDTRIDVPNLAGESLARAVRLAALKSEHARLWNQATDKQKSAWDIPIRSTEDIPDELRKIVNQIDEGSLSKADVDGLTPKFQETLYEHLFPADTRLPGAKWIDQREIGDMWRYPNEPGFGTKLASAINDPARVFILFGRAAYGVGNLLGNSAMLLMESAGAPNNLRKAIQANKRYGERNVRTMEALTGEGKSLAFSPDDLIQTKISRTMAHAWNALVDRKFRLAAFIHWAERKGYKTEADMTRLLDKATTDKKILGDRNEIKRRANKDMVEFDNLSNFEKNTMRHLVFVYPWVSRSVVWSLRTMVDHPLKTWSLVQLGKEGEKFIKEDDFTEQVPEWYHTSGYFPMYTDDEGNPKVVNPQSINTFTSLAETLRLARSFKENVPYTSPEEFSSPALELLANVRSGRDSFGREFEEGRVEGSFRELVESFPQIRTYKKLRGQDTGEGLEADKRPSFVHGGTMDAFMPLLLAGYWPRTPDTEALASDWFRDQPKEIVQGKRSKDRAQAIRERLSVERRAIMQAEKATGEILGKPVPQEVREALELQMRFTEAYAQAAIRNPRDASGDIKEVPLSPGNMPSALGKRTIQLVTLKKIGKIDEEQFDLLVKGVHKAAKDGKAELDRWGAQFDRDYLQIEALEAWHDERDKVLDVVANAPKYLTSLRKEGLWQGGVGQPSQEGLLQIGRQYVTYERELQARKDDSGARSDLETLDNSLDRAWMDEQDKPVNVDGKKYPSPVRLDWARKTPEQRLNAIADNAVASWDTLSNFEKELVGKKVAPKVSYGWVIANAVMDGYRGNVTAEDVPAELRDMIPDALPDGADVEREHKIAIAKWVDKNYAPGFYKDFLFSLQPKFERVRVLPVITKSKANDEWLELMQAAGSQYALIKRAREGTVNYTITSVQDGWDDYAKNTLYPYIQENSTETFRNELELLGGIDFLRTLIAD